ncbi:MAG: hypothetical protein OEY20_15925 [Gemmatimonadota bacterium]|nr:hypothetical protein [Gemmatimonadota bacterium]MDH5198731.1 hypothetical protein [Gemmatimonadota bacterium]
MRPLTLVGYFPKRQTQPPPWLLEMGIQEVASVSACVAPGPDDWAQAWRHNAWGFFDGPDVAWSVVPEDQRATFRLYAYALYPSEFADGVERPSEVVATGVTPLDSAFAAVGYDVVSRSTSSFFECSPLSCNYLAGEIDTNEYCLVRELEEAVALARRVELRRCEPGPYYVLQVWRRLDPAGGP